MYGPNNISNNDFRTGVTNYDFRNLSIIKLFNDNKMKSLVHSSIHWDNNVKMHS